jgi:large subunit ribosomal protein L4
MATVEVKDVSGKAVGSMELDDKVFAQEMNEHLLWETVKWQRAKKRSGNASTKTRGEIRATNQKPWKQKGTGRARSGDRKSPVWVGGGTVFGPKPRSYAYSMPRKARQRALRSALSLRLSENKLVVVDDFKADGKTKNVAGTLAALGCAQPESKALIVEVLGNELLVRGARNLPRSKWIAPEGLNVYDVLNHPTLVMTKESVAKVTEALS